MSLFELSIFQVQYTPWLVKISNDRYSNYMKLGLNSSKTSLLCVDVEPSEDSEMKVFDSLDGGFFDEEKLEEVIKAFKGICDSCDDIVDTLPKGREALVRVCEDLMSRKLLFSSEESQDIEEVQQMISQPNKCLYESCFCNTTSEYCSSHKLKCRSCGNAVRDGVNYCKNCQKGNCIVPDCNSTKGVRNKKGFIYCSKHHYKCVKKKCNNRTPKKWSVCRLDNCESTM